MTTQFDPQLAADQLAADNPGMTFVATDDGVYMREHGKDHMIFGKMIDGKWYNLRPSGDEPTHAFPAEEHHNAYIACKSVVSAA